MQEKVHRENAALEKETEKTSDPTRREVVIGGAALAGGLFMGISIGTYLSNLAHEKNSHEKERKFVALVKEMEKDLRSGEAARIIKEGKPYEVFDAILAPSSPYRSIRPDMLKGTPFDIASPNVSKFFPSVQIGLERVPDELNANQFRVKIISHDNEHPAKKQPLHGYGNGVVLSEDQVLTNKHVAEPILRANIRGLGMRPHPSFADLAVITLPSRDYISPDVLAGLPKWDFIEDAAEKDLDGAFVVLAGIDPDVSADEFGLKPFPGFLKKIDEKLLKDIGSEKTLQSSSVEERNGTLNSYLVIGMPIGQSLFVTTSITRFSHMVHAYALGTSGSPIITFQGGNNETKKIAGLTHSAIQSIHAPGAEKNMHCCHEFFLMVPTLKNRDLAPMLSPGPHDIHP